MEAMKEAIRQRLETANEEQIRVIYTFITNYIPGTFNIPGDIEEER